MTLDLTLDQPAEEAVQQSDAAPAAVLVTLVTVDGVVVRVAERGDGSLALMPAGNRAPVVLDRFQRGAFLAALSEGAS